MAFALGAAPIAAGGALLARENKRKRGKRRRREQRALEQTNAALAEFDIARTPVFRQAAGSQALGQGLGALTSVFQSLPGAVQNVTDPSRPLAFGLSAPGVLEGLVSNIQTQQAATAQRQARQVSQTLPQSGGTAARAIQEIFRQRATEAGQLETGLRAQAAQQDLGNRLAVLGGLSSTLPSITAGIGGALSPFEFLSGVAANRANIRRGLAAEFFGQSRNIEANRLSNLRAIGQGLGSLVGAGVSAAAGGVGGAGG